MIKDYNPKRRILSVMLINPRRIYVYRDLFIYNSNHSPLMPHLMELINLGYVEKVKYCDSYNRKEGFGFRLTKKVFNKDDEFNYLVSRKSLKLFSGDKNLNS